MALCTAAEVRAYANAGAAADDTLIASIIGRVDAAFARWCGLPPTDSGTQTMESATYTMYVDARMYQDPTRPASMFLPVNPLVSVTSVHIDPERDYDAATLQASSTYDLDLYAGAIVLRDDAVDSWSTAVRANKVVAVCGYATVPDDLAEAAIIQAAHIFTNKGTAGRRSKSTGQNSISADRLSLLDEVKERLAHFRQVVP
jgi:hypothetical protein